MIKQVLLAFQFLTIVPVKVAGEITGKEVAGASAFFPLAGAFQGLVTSLSALLLLNIAPPDITAGFALLLLILSNGGFDLDGLADTFDALAVKSSGDAERDRAKRLLVMKDSSTGAMGAIALIIAILLKFVLMGRLLSDIPFFLAGPVLFLMPVFSKWITVPVMYHARSAKKDGLGRIFIEGIGLEGVIISTALTAALFLLASLPQLTGISLTSGIGQCVFLLTAFYLFGLLAIKFLTKRFGGLTGDHFGALTEISEILFLSGAYLWLRH